MSVECATYMRRILDLHMRRAAVYNAIGLLRKHRGEFDCIAFRGMSGALLAAPVASALGKNLILVRKDEKRHSMYRVEGVRSKTRYIIVDDFVSTGDTVRAIIEAIVGEGYAIDRVPLLVVAATKKPKDQTEHAERVVEYGNHNIKVYATFPPDLDT